MDDALGCPDCNYYYATTEEGIYDFVPKDIDNEIEDISSKLVGWIKEDGLENVQRKYMVTMNDEK